MATAVDAAGNVYMSGNTKSTAGIATTGAFQVTYAGLYDDFVVKFNSSGARQWATYYGGSGDDFGGTIALDGSGNIYLAGTTKSSAGIATAGSFRDTYIGGYDAFLVKFSSAGVRKWATYYGGTGDDFAWGVATDRSGNVCISGQTKSDTGIASGTAFQDTMGSSGVAYDAFLAKFDSNGTRLWGTYYGGELGDFSNALAIDDSNNIYLTGLTESMTGIGSPGSYQDTNVGGLHDAFIAKFNSDGTRQWATYFGGTGDDNVNGVCVDATGNVYITGNTASMSGIATPGAYHDMPGGVYDGYLAKFARDGSLLWATYFGGEDNDYAYGVATDTSGNVFIAGSTASVTEIATPGSYQEVFAGGTGDGFLAEFDSFGGILWSTYYGGGNDDGCYFAAADPAGGIYIAGSSQSPSGIATSGAYQTTLAGGSSTGDAFLAKFTPGGLKVKDAANEKGQIGLFPNPTTKRLMVSSTMQMIDVTITNLTGQVVSFSTCNANKAEIDVSSFPAGSYLVIINGAGNCREVKEFVKE